MMQFAWVVGRLGSLDFPDDPIPGSFVEGSVRMKGSVPLTDQSFDAGRNPRGIRRVYTEAFDGEEVVEGFCGRA